MPDDGWPVEFLGSEGVGVITGLTDDEEPFGAFSVCSGKTESASSMKCCRSFLYSPRKSSRDCLRRSISSIGLLLGKRLTDDLPGLLVGLAADSIGIDLGVRDELIGTLLRDDEHLRDLALGGDDAGVLGLSRYRSGWEPERSGAFVLLHKLRDLCLRGRQLLLGAVEATLEVSNLLKHGINLA